MSNSKQLVGAIEPKPSADTSSLSQPRPAAPGQHTAPAAERSTAALGTSAAGYAALETTFRSHHETNPACGRGPYEHYRLVYRYGYDLGTDPRYRTAVWADVVQKARPRWEERNPGTWALFHEAIRYAWDQARRFA